MKSLLTLATVFGASFGGVWYLDVQGELPELYTGPPAASADDRPPPPPRWYTIGEPLTVMVRGGETARLVVALQLPDELPEMVEDGDAEGRLAQEPVIRALVTDTIMRSPPRLLRSSDGRTRLERRMRARIRAHTDVRVRRVLIPDVIVG